MSGNKKNINVITIFSLGLILLIGTTSAYAEDLRKIVSLTGYWKFSVGDREEWSSPEFNDSNWDQIRVPQAWEHQGYSEYNGFAWYRREFKIYDNSSSGPIYLLLGHIDDVDEVYLNGKLLSKNGTMPPFYQSAYNVFRKYLIPKEYLKINESNYLAVRVYDNQGGGGITHGKVGVYIDEDYELLDLDLSGSWKFHPGDNKQWRNKIYNDELWDNILVPSHWENQGYENYDGYGWYRKEFRIPSKLKNEDLYLILGKIDDYDYVYLNGELIGTVFDLAKDGHYRRRGYEYNARRIYKIPRNSLKWNEANTLSIRVFDSHGGGGIYQGPIGIMRESNHRAYQKRHYDNQDFWDFIIDQFFYD